MLNMRQLHNEQKKWLFENGYVTAKVLDACVERGWQDYFINYFNWLIDNESNNGWYKLMLQSKDNGNVMYTVDVNLRKNYTKLMAI